MCVFGRLRTILEVSGGFAELQHVTTGRTSSDAVAFSSCLQICFDYN